MNQMKLNLGEFKGERKSKMIAQEKPAEDIGGSARNFRYIVEKGTQSHPMTRFKVFAIYWILPLKVSVFQWKNLLIERIE